MLSSILCLGVALAGARPVASSSTESHDPAVAWRMLVSALSDDINSVGASRAESDKSWKRGEVADIEDVPDVALDGGGVAVWIPSWMIWNQFVWTGRTKSVDIQSGSMAGRSSCAAPMSPSRQANGPGRHRFGVAIEPARRRRRTRLFRAPAGNELGRIAEPAFLASRYGLPGPRPWLRPIAHHTLLRVEHLIPGASSPRSSSPATALPATPGPQ